MELKMTNKRTENRELDYPNIVTVPKILGGSPHIKGTRLSVCQVLSRLYVLGSIDRVSEYYENINPNDIKQAIAYAQDFIEQQWNTRHDEWISGDPEKTQPESPDKMIRAFKDAHRMIYMFSVQGWSIKDLAESFETTEDDITDVLRAVIRKGR